ncbi:GapA-binding peptide SR1P [Halalkalibacillus halophilus]|nr:GapA-binding peptide SR1P [Halalkalibacillus halophilus]
MGTILCSTCQKVIDVFDVEKVTVLYSTHCSCEKPKK